jgi:hypothetical protein
MSHVPVPVLRRMQDEPLAVPDADRRHLAGCARCQASRQAAEADAAFAAGLLGTPPADLADLAERDTGAEWEKLVARLRAPAPRPAAARAPRRLPRRLAAASVSTGTAITAGLLVVGVAAAAALTTVYAPTHVVPVRVGESGLSAFRSITGLGSGLIGGGFPGPGPVQLEFGQLTWRPSGHAHKVSTVARAEAETGLAAVAPAALPQGTGPVASVVVQPEVTATLKFSADAGHGVGGSTLTVRGGPAVLVEYAGQPGQPAPDTLAVITMRRPVATSTGATADQLEDFLLAQPGVPPVLAQEIRLLGQSALPVPVPSGVTEQHVTLGGSPAVLLHGPAGAASGVIWEGKDGVVHAVAGLVTSEDILNVARQLS